MGMGLGFCCCGDAPLPGSSSSSKGPLTQDCFRCGANCNTPAVKLPAMLLLSTSLFEDGAYYFNPPNWTAVNCTNCSGTGTYPTFRAGALSLLNGQVMVPRTASACEYVTDCVTWTEKNDVVGTVPCEAPYDTLRKHWICQTKSDTGTYANNLNYYAHLQFPNSCGMPVISVPHSGKTNGTPTATPNPCLAQANRLSGVAADVIENEVFVCDPFYYSATLWFSNGQSDGCCVKPIGTDCCAGVTSARYNRVDVVITGL